MFRYLLQSKFWRDLRNNVKKVYVLFDSIECIAYKLGNVPKIKKRECMVFDLNPVSPPLTLTMVFLLRIFKICTENGQNNTIKTGLSKDLVLGDPLPPLHGQRPYFCTF